MTVSLTLSQAYAYAKEGVAERGAGFVYRKNQDPTAKYPGRCSYFHGSDPGCFVGYIISKLGVTKNQLDSINMGLNCSASNELFAMGVLANDTATAMFLSSLQSQQDNRQPWGIALRNTVDWMIAGSHYRQEMLQAMAEPEAIKAADPKPQPAPEPDDDEKEKEDLQPVGSIFAKFPVFTQLTASAMMKFHKAPQQPAEEVKELVDA